MMGVIRHKIWSDLWNNKGRTLQVVLIIAMGAFAIGATLGGSDLMRQVMSKDWRASSPAMIWMAADPEIDDDTLTALKSVEGVEEVEGLLTTNIEWRLSPAEPWQAAGLMARDDYEEQKFNKLTLISGDWPNDKSFAMEKGNDSFFNIPLGGQIYIRVNDKERVVKVDGKLAHCPAAQYSGGLCHDPGDGRGAANGNRLSLHAHRRDVLAGNYPGSVRHRQLVPRSWRNPDQCTRELSVSVERMEDWTTC